MRRSTAAAKAAPVAPDGLADRDEIRARARQRLDFVDIRRIGDARNLENLRPPGDPVQHGLEGGPAAVRLAEHDVVGARFASQHGVVAGRESAAAGDTVGLERRSRGLERIGPGQVRAVGFGARDEPGMAVEQQRRPVALDQDAQRLDALEQGGLVAVLEPHQHGRDIGRVQRVGQIVRDRARHRRAAA